MIVGGSLVWLKGMRAPFAEKWPRGSERPKAAAILKEYELNIDEFSLMIAILEQRYPCPTEKP